ncbi:hypothetical protein V8F20_009974 [Naviculisporaceae sp. PSN 640]
MAPSMTDDSRRATPKSEKKHKREKSEHKKRAREEDDPAGADTTPRKSKKYKSEEFVVDDDSDVEVSVPPTTNDKKSKKEKRLKEDAGAQEPDTTIRDDESSKEPKKSKKNKKHQEDQIQDGKAAETPKKAVSDQEEKRKDKKSKKDRKKRQGEEELVEAEADVSMMDVDSAPIQEADAEATEKKKKKKEKKEKKKRATSPEAESMELDTTDLSIRTKNKNKTKLAEVPSDPQFPFFTQTTSIYVPFYPIGFDKPLTNIAAQHLEPLLNHYSTTLKGVLLKYSNLNLSDRPAKASLTNPPTDETPALLYSRDEYAVGFGWLTFDALLFKPARGKWMEGVLQIQSEGHIGVVCWGKFNASIEAKRLPRGWVWIDFDKPKTNGSSSLPSPAYDTEADAGNDKQSESDNLDGEELQVVEQIHSTGYWVDEQGRKVTGKLRFRIKNFDVGLAGDYGYLSIEGTFLDDNAERALADEEREKEKRRRAVQNPTGNLRPLSRRVPEFSVTKFGKEEEEEDSQARVVYHKGSRPGTPDN